MLLFHHAPQTQQRALVDVEVGIDRIERHDRRERRGVGLDEIARINHAAADPAADLRRDLGECQVQLGHFPARHGCGKRRVGLGPVETGLFELFLGSGFLFEELGGPFFLPFEPLKMRLGLRHGGDGAVEFGAIRPIVDLKQERSFLNQIAIFEMILIEIAADPSAHFDRLDGDRLSGELLILGHHSFGGLLDKDLGRLGLRLLGLFTFATRNRGHRDQQKHRTNQRRTGHPAEIRHRRLLEIRS